jgi:fused signal recognition particle receptor
MLSFFKKWVAELRDGPVDWDELEAVLIQSDLGPGPAHEILERLRRQPLSAATVQEAAAREIAAFWSEPVRSLRPEPGFQVWLVAGVNGTGKTTTTAKLADRFQRAGRKVHLVAADTFRAAAIEQLKIWSERLGVPIHCGRENGDPAAAAFEGVAAARAAGSDLVLIDTAGRLHNKENLMRELEKVKRVIAKQEPGAPHEVLLVIDGTSGTNGLSQASQFHAALGVTGVVVTKLDSSSKGGVVASLKAQLGLETLMIGTGEGVDDWRDFDPRAYVARFFARE